MTENVLIAAVIVTGIVAAFWIIAWRGKMLDEHEFKMASRKKPLIKEMESFFPLMGFSMPNFWTETTITTSRPVDDVAPGKNKSRTGGGENSKEAAMPAKKTTGKTATKAKKTPAKKATKKTATKAKAKKPAKKASSGMTGLSGLGM